METTKENKNVKMPSYAVKLGRGMFAGIPQSAWYCKYCMCKPSTWSNHSGDYRPTGTSSCSKSPTGYHVWEHD